MSEWNDTSSLLHTAHPLLCTCRHTIRYILLQICLVLANMLPMCQHYLIPIVKQLNATRKCLPLPHNLVCVCVCVCECVSVCVCSILKTLVHQVAPTPSTTSFDKLVKERQVQRKDFCVCVRVCLCLMRQTLYTVNSFKDAVDQQCEIWF